MPTTPKPSRTRTVSVVAATHNVEVMALGDRSERSDGHSTAAIIERYFDQMLGE